MKEAYLTIDDSPTKHTSDFVDWLSARDIPAAFFCIGSSYKDLDFPCEGMEQRPEPILKAIDHGYVIGNHTYTHPRFSDLSLSDMKEQVLKTEAIIESLYKQAGKTRTHKLFRFPHIDRGCGAWPFNLDELNEQHKKIIIKLFCEGLNVKDSQPTSEDFEQKERFQEFLKSEGFRSDVYKNINFDWYRETEMADAADSLLTYSTSDWMVNPDFKDYAKKYGWAYPTVKDLKRKMDEDDFLWSESSANLIVAHDHNHLFTHTTALLEYMIQKGIHFKEFK